LNNYLYLNIIFILLIFYFYTFYLLFEGYNLTSMDKLQ